MSTAGSRVAIAVGVLFGVLLVGTWVFRLPCPKVPEASSTGRSAQRGSGAAAANAVSGVSGPNAAEARSAIERAVRWLRSIQIEPVADGIEGFRYYVLEVRSWHVLYLYESDRARKEDYRKALLTRLAPLGDGSRLSGILETSKAPKFIAELLVALLIARDVGHDLPAIEKRLPELLRAGIEVPARPVPLQIALAGLIESIGLKQGATTAELRPRGMLQTRPKESKTGVMEAYLLTHEIFGLCDYGMRPLELAPDERDWLERTLPFWALFYRLARRTDIGSELLICNQVLGTSNTYEYGEGLAYLLECQSPEGYFTEPAQGEAAAGFRPADRIHLFQVGLQAVLAHEALVEGRGPLASTLKRGI